MLRYPCLRVGQSWNHAGLQGPGSSGERRRRAPCKDEPEHVRVAVHLEKCQRGHERRSPEKIVDKGPAATPQGEEGISPAVLQHEPWQCQTEREERESRCATQQGGYREDACAGRQADCRGGTSAARHGASP